MTLDFVTGQLRLALVAVLAYGGGRGWFTPADATFITALAGALGPLLIPWAWSIYANAGQINVASGSAAAAVARVEKIDPASASTGAASAIQAAKVAVVLVAVMLAGLVVLPGEASAQARKPQVLNLPIDPLHLNTPVPTAGTAATNTLAGVNFTTIGQKLQAIAKDVIDKGIADLGAASTDAQNHNDKIAQPCWDAQVAFLKQLPSEWQTPPTDIGPALAIQISRDLLNTITGNDVTSLKVACAALIGDQITIINQTLSIIGVAGIAGLPAGL
jgi:hypothetical protein